MELPYIMAISALTGSVLAGLTSGIIQWLSVRSQVRAGRLAGDLARRQDLFEAFIVAASKAYGDAVTNSEPDMAEIAELYALVSRMRVLCAPKTVRCADRVLRLIVDTYFTPNSTVRDLRELVNKGAGIDPLKEFSDVAREELHAPYRHVVAN